MEGTKTTRSESDDLDIEEPGHHVNEDFDHQLSSIRALVASLQQFEAMRWLPGIEMRLRAGVSGRLREDYLRLAHTPRLAS